MIHATMFTSEEAYNDAIRELDDTVSLYDRPVTSEIDHEYENQWAEGEDYSLEYEQNEKAFDQEMLQN